MHAYTHTHTHIRRERENEGKAKVTDLDEREIERPPLTVRRLEFMLLREREKEEDSLPIATLLFPYFPYATQRAEKVYMCARAGGWESVLYYAEVAAKLSRHDAALDSERTCTYTARAHSRARIEGTLRSRTAYTCHRRRRDALDVQFRIFIYTSTRASRISLEILAKYIYICGYNIL